MRDYEQWHAGYADPGSGLSWRLGVVQRHIAQALDRVSGPIRVVSCCSGDGRDVLGVLAQREDADRVSATLVELHPRIADAAREAGAGTAATVEVRTADAGSTDSYPGAVPAHLVLMIGIFGNISDTDLEATVAASAQFCRPGATLLWSRGRRTDDIVAAERGDGNDVVRTLFTRAGFTELDYATLDTGSRPAVGAVRYDGPPQPFVAGRRLFTFLR